mmetsp:Transcript_1803/g.2418  ORF Transcript_1803/g.2418 Transcript_1803/m.2418 type:complete len:91 (-) Transcript_1803:90-362(-)
MSSNNNNNNTEQQRQRQREQEELEEEKNQSLLLEVLRVSQSELVSGNTRGRVYTRLSPGSAPLLTDRVVAIGRVTEQIRTAVLRSSAGNK